MANFTSTHTGSVVDAAVTKITATSSSATELNILDGVTATTAEINILDGVTATTAEINILDGVTATAAEINILDGVTSTTAELNILDGVTSTAAELNILDGVTSTAAELNVLDGYTGSVTELNYLDTLHATGVTATEFDYLDGVTSNIQTQLDAKIEATLTSEQVQDIVGAMFSSNTESGITVSYEDGDGTIDLTVATQSDNNFTTTLLNKLNAIEASADVTDATNVTAAGALMDSELTSIADVKALDQSVISGASPTFGTANMTDASNKRFMTDAQETKLDSVESNATADQTDEEIQDIVGAMFSSNTETGITATYQDADGTIDLVVGTLNQDTTGNAATATKIASITNSDIVQLTDTQTLTNKTLASPAFTGDIDFSDASTPKFTVTDTTNTVKTEIRSQDTSGNIGTTTDHNLGIIRNGVGMMTFFGGYTMHNNGGADIDFRAKDSSGNVVFKVDAGDSKTHITTLDVSGDADIDGTLEADAITVNGTALNTVIAGVTVANATLAATATVSDSTANTNFPVVFHDESNGLLDDTNALRYNPSTGTLLVPNLSVAGTTTTVDTVTMEASNAIIFEGATADAHETTLSIVDPTADHTQYLINQGGYIPVLAAATTTAITSTPAELNVLDGITSTTAELNILDGVTSTAAELNILDGVTATTAELNIMDGVTATTAELNYVDGVTSNIQTQLDATLDTAGTGIDISSTTISVDVSDFMSNGADNRILTATGTDAMNAEANFTFNGTHAMLAATSALYFDGGTHTYIQESSDDFMKIFVGGQQMLGLFEGSTDSVFTPDDVRLGVGNSPDLVMYHDATNSHILNSNGDLIIKNAASDEDISIQVSDDGSTTTAILIDGSEIGRVKLPNDNQRFVFGAGDDFQMFHDGTNSHFENLTGDYYITNHGDDEDIIFRCDDGSGGVTAYLTLDGSEARLYANLGIRVPDSKTVDVGGAGDGQFFHNGTNTFLTNSTGAFYIDQYVDDGDMIFRCDDGSGGNTPYLTLDGGAEKIIINKSMRFADSVNAYFGAGEDLEIKHDGSNSVIKANGTGNLTIRQDTADADILLRCDDGSGGIATYITLDGSAERTVFDKHIRVNDNVEVQIGSSNDMPIYHNGTNSLIDNYTGSLIIQTRADDEDIILKSDDGSGGLAAYITLDGSAALTQFDKHTKHSDSIRADFGNSSDFRIYHDGSNSSLENHTGALYIDNHADDQDIIFRIDDGGTGASEIMRIDASSSRIGIGTSSPGSTLHINTTDDASVRFTRDGGSAFSIEHDTSQIYWYNRTINKSILEFEHSGPLVVNEQGHSTVDFRVEGDSNDHLIFADASRDEVGIGTTPSYKLDVAGTIRVHPGANDSDIRLEGSAANQTSFRINNGAGNNRVDFMTGGANAMTINSSQNVGIGTTSPSMKLNISHGDQDGLRFTAANTHETFIDFGDTDDNDAGSIRYDHNDNSLAFRVNASERARINSSGNVGIGTSILDAGAKLNVVSGSSAYTAQFSRHDADDGLFLHSEAESTHYNWLITTQDNVDKGFEITPSTGVGNRTFSTPAFVIKADTGNVGIGTTSPEGKVHIYNGNASVAPDSDADELVVENSGDSGISILSGESNGDSGSLIFGSQNDGNGAGVVWDYYNKILNVKTQNSSGILRFASNNNVEAMRIDANGNMRFSDNASNPSAATNMAFLFNDGGEMKVLDELGNTTTISPHNFELIPEGASEDMAFAYHSMKHTPEGKLKKVNVDMMKLARLVEQLTGEKLVYIEEGEKDG